MFHTLGSDLPRRGALLYGGLMAMAVFAALALAINHGGYRRWALPGAAFDDSHSGLLVYTSWSTSELIAKTRAAISPASQPKPPIDFTASRADAILRALDKDGDGVISSTEASAETNPGVRALLARADANRDGVITRAELLAALRSE